MAKDDMDGELKNAVDDATGLVDMKMSKEERKKMFGEPMAAASDDSEGPTYPYGLELRLENAALKKLGLDKLPGVGEKLEIEAMAVVESVSEEEQMRNGKKAEPRRHVTLQIRKMAVEKA